MKSKLEVVAAIIEEMESRNDERVIARRILDAIKVMDTELPPKARELIVEAQQSLARIMDSQAGSSWPKNVVTATPEDFAKIRVEGYNHGYREGVESQIERGNKKLKEVREFCEDLHESYSLYENDPEAPRWDGYFKAMCDVIGVLEDHGKVDREARRMQVAKDMFAKHKENEDDVEWHQLSSSATEYWLDLADASIKSLKVLGQC